MTGQLDTTLNKKPKCSILYTKNFSTAASVHKDFGQKLKYARIWGSGKHDGIMAKRDHILEDGDIVELHLKTLNKPSDCATGIA